MLDKQSKIYEAGHNGLVGSAIWNNLLQREYMNLVGRDSSIFHQMSQMLANKCLKMYLELHDNPPFLAWKDGLDEAWN